MRIATACRRACEISGSGLWGGWRLNRWIRQSCSPGERSDTRECRPRMSPRSCGLQLIPLDPLHRGMGRMRHGEGIGHVRDTLFEMLHDAEESLDRFGVETG